MQKIKNPGIEETTFHVRKVDHKVSQLGRGYYTLELIGEGGELDGLITYATVFPGTVHTVQGRHALNTLDDEMRRAE